MKAVLTTKPKSAYDDRLDHRYHFPRTYLNQIERSVGDWIIYYEPSSLSENRSIRDGRKSYFAVARINRLERDPNHPDLFYAYMEDYLEFHRPVPFSEGSHYYESKLQKEDGSPNRGAFGRSVRNIPDHEYDAILKSGFHIPIVGEDRYYKEKLAQISAPKDKLPQHGFSDVEQTPFERPVIEQLTKRPFRDSAFRQAVISAYADTCAMTGLKIINGGGRPEVQAAHIKSVADNGPDSIQNGLALSGTVHWMFDRGLISIDDDYTILTANNNLPDQVKGMFNETGKLTLPKRNELKPHPEFLKFHRQKFKG